MRKKDEKAKSVNVILTSLKQYMANFQKDFPSICFL